MRHFLMEQRDRLPQVPDGQGLELGAWKVADLDPNEIGGYVDLHP